MPRRTQLDIDRSHARLVRKLMSNSSSAAIALIDLLRRGRRLGEPVGEEVEWCLVMLDALGICGDNLYVLWGDICSQSADEMLSLLRDCHEGCNGVSRDTIWHAITCCNQEAASLRELQLVSEVPGL